MIKIGKSEQELEILANEHYKKVLIEFNLDEKIQAKINNASPNTPEFEFYDNIHANLEDIIIGKPSRLEELSQMILPLYDNLENFRLNTIIGKKQKTEAKSNLKNEIFSIFDYKSFTTLHDSQWAYDYASSLDLNVCPYCNNQYTFTIKTNRGKTRPQFDHFFYKAEHPYFAISFYNLIPCCSVCNASFKGSKDFKPSTHIHPFVEGVEDTLVFSTQIDSVDYLLGKTDFNVSLKPVPNYNKDKLKRGKKSVKVFHLDEIYNYHKKYVGEIICKKYGSPKNVMLFFQDYSYK